MVGLLLHVLYLLGKCIYDRYRVKRTRLLPDVANEAELFRYDYDTFDDVSEFEDTCWWTHRTINNFFPPAYIQRYCAVTEVLSQYKGKLSKVVDFGCAELGFLVYLKGIPEVEQILCVDVDREVLERNERKAAPLITEMMSSRERKLTIEICEGSVTDNDIKLKHANAVICIELIEHLYPDTLIDLPFNIFGYIKPEVVIVTTPNVEFNVVFPNMSGYRHPDHKFEWTREQFQDWAQNIVVRYPYYSVTFQGICNGPEGTEELGAVTQMAVFHRILPRNESRIEIIMPDEYIKLRGQHALYNTIAKYEYSTGQCDNRSDERKILDEATYYIHYLNDINDDEDTIGEVHLTRILEFMSKYTVSLETLRSILTDAGWSVVDRENGPAVLLEPFESSDEMSNISNDYSNMENDDWDNEYENSRDDSINMENIWDYETGERIGEIYVDAGEVYGSRQNLHTEDWNEESNVTNEESRLDYITNSSVNDASADTNGEYSSRQNPHAEGLHEEPDVTSEENRWGCATNSSINVASADTNGEYSSRQNPHAKSLREEPNVTSEENRWGCATNSSINVASADTNGEYSSRQNPHTESLHEKSNVTNEENKQDYVTNSPINEPVADANEEYLSEQDLHTESWLDSPNFTDDEDGWDYESRINKTHNADIEEESLSTQNPHTENWPEESNFTNEMNRRDCEFGLSINQTFADANEEYSSVENPRIENWHEELSIIIPENCSINQENTYLYDGENSLVEESHLSKELRATCDDSRKRSAVRNTAESLMYIERELPSDSISLTLNEIEVETQVIASDMPSAPLNDSLQLKISVDNITAEPALLQSDQINLATTKGITSMLNFQPRMSVSRSSTSPTPLYFNSETNNSLQDFSYYQNESLINNQCLLNSTFRQSDIATETVVTSEESVLGDTCFKDSLPKKDTRGSEINFSLHMPPNHHNCSVEQGRGISDKNQICEDNDMADVMSSDAYSNFNRQPKYTSSPHTKTPTTNIVNKSLKYRELIPAMNSNVLPDTTEEIKETVSDTSDSSSLEANQKSNNSIAGTIKPYATSSGSGVTNISRRNVDCSANSSTQQKLCLENKDFSGVDNSISIELIQDTNRDFAKNDRIDHESDTADDTPRNVDAHRDLSLGNESINRKDKSVYCTLAETDVADSTDAKERLENAISDLAQSSVREKRLIPPRDLLSLENYSESQSVSKYSSSDCAKETSVLRNDRFVPCTSSEDTSNVNVTSVLKNEEIVGTSKDISNIAGLVSNVEAKPSSPLETPPNSWSPEIMDSGYPNSASAQDITPEYELPSIAQDYIPDSESPSVAEAPRLGVLEPVEVENGDLANNNRDGEGNNMMAVDANDIENLQPLIDVLENDLENENDIYVMQNGFPIWLLRILDMANPLDFDMQARQNLRIPNEVAGANYVGHDEGFDSSSESENDVAYNEMENDNGHDK
ncbi:PREDICTED: uncharacterized protein LOC105455721 [Wasmannia auropunctata]|uniref:uncharacterized protein LOC105455721 n=1 Tax=Wasmannia auropunctata TaxID=64793 RepID=UPI0005EE92E2|nr:PREDICTED: uncharacterized protein LOC105455721 [Wasmannia auropunctata]